jgi:hypothetical protein
MHTTKSINRLPARQTRSTPLILTSPKGDKLSVSINPAGQVIIRSVANKGGDLDSVRVKGFTKAQAQSQAKGFWGKLWDAIKSVGTAVVDAVSFEFGGLKCRPNASVGFTKGKPSSVSFGVKCS